MDGDDLRDAVILSLADRLHICSRLLTAAAERLGWDNMAVRELIDRLDKSVEDSKHHAGIIEDASQ